MHWSVSHSKLLQTSRIFISISFSPILTSIGPSSTQSISLPDTCKSRSEFSSLSLSFFFFYRQNCISSESVTCHSRRKRQRVEALCNPFVSAVSANQVVFFKTLFNLCKQSGFKVFDFCELKKNQQTTKSMHNYPVG